MEEFTVILAVIFLIFGVLQIILFFKIWGMCDNISKMRKGTVTAEDYIESAQLQAYIGNKEKAKELYLCAKYRYENKEKCIRLSVDYTEERIKEIDVQIAEL